MYFARMYFVGEVSPILPTRYKDLRNSRHTCNGNYITESTDTSAGTTTYSETRKKVLLNETSSRK